MEHIHSFKSSFLFSLYAIFLFVSFLIQVNQNLWLYAYVTAIQVRGKTTKVRMMPIGGFSWKSYHEQIDSDDKTTFTTTGLLEQVNVSRDLINSDKITFTTTGLLEQVNVTRDRTDYLWYTTW